jgi:ribulose-5-phosphate 4-epimerase/fuculose-1-phosphate aldolase
MSAALKPRSQERRPSDCSAEEWAVRCDLAAAYRLCALYGWTDLNNTHISARVPGTEDTFLLNPFGLFFDEITASSLIKVDRDGNVLSESGYGMNLAGFIIHSAIHMSDPDLHYVMHTHSRYGVAVSMQAEGLLPMSQKALTVMGWLNYHDYEGTATDLDERPRIVRDLGTKRLLVLRNHGLLSVGKTMGEAFVWIYRLETACRHQIDAMAGGAKLQPLSAETQEKTITTGLKMYGPGGFIEVGREWPALLRQLERAGGDDYRC